MSDLQTRRLARQAFQGDVHAEAWVLVDRVRRGELREERLRLAAYLRHPAARVALGAEAPVCHTNLRRVRRTLSWSGLGAILRAVGAIGLQLQVAPRFADGRRAVRLQVALLACHRCLGGHPVLAPTLRAWAFLGAQSYQRDEPASELLLRKAFDLAQRLIEKDDVHAALKAALVPWALGEGDPVRDRLLARYA